jgi:hypothetical protein
VRVTAVMLLALLALSSSCLAEERTDWSKTDTALQLALLGTYAVDMSQSLYISKHPDRYSETNPALGNHPSQTAVLVYFPASFAAHTLIAYYLPTLVHALGGGDELAKNSRRIWQSVWIGTEVICITLNLNAGVRFEF